jgi:hypothetical protein
MLVAEDGLAIGIRQEPLERRATCLCDPIARDPAWRVAGYPVLERHRLGHGAVHHGGPHRLARAHVADDHGLLHVLGHGEAGPRLGQATQDAPGLAVDVGVRGGGRCVT